MKVTISVTAEDIAQGQTVRDNRYCGCPVFLAMRRALGRDVCVRLQKWSYEHCGGEEYPLTKALTRYIIAADAFKPIRPRSFRLEIPEATA